MNHLWQRGFVLHRQAYTETSLLVDVFTEHSGRLRLLAKGARTLRSPLKSILQPFVPLLLRWTKNEGLKVLTKAEPAAIALPLQQIGLYSGFYVNELLCRVLAQESPYVELFQDYLYCLTQLAQVKQVEPCLRQFEFKLLTALGYGVDFTHCFGTGKLVSPDMRYEYREQKGFIASLIANNHSFYGRELLAFAQLDFQDKGVLQAAKRFTRIMLKPYLGHRPLKSRELFQQHFVNKK